MLRRVSDLLQEYLRINAIRRMLNIVEVKKSEIALLVGIAFIYALLEGIGVSMLLPVLQFAEGGQTAVIESSGAFWTAVASLLAWLNLPVTLWVLLVLAFIPILLRQAVYFLNAMTSAIVSARIGIRMRMKTLGVVMDADPEFFNRYHVGRVVSVVLIQSDAAGNAVLAVIRLFSVALLIALYVTILAVLSVPLTGTSIFFAILVSWLARTNLTRIREFGVTAARVNQEMIAKAVDRLGMIRLIKLRDQKEAESKRIEDYSQTTRAIAVKQARLGAMVEITSDPLLMFSVFFTLFIGISVLGMSLAQLGLVVLLLSRLNGKVKEFNAGRQLISQTIPGLILVNEMTADAKASNTITRGSVKFEGLSRELAFSHVSFDYPDTVSVDDGMPSTGKPVLKDVSLEMPAGSFTAIVGRSGGGKSTLVELIPRLRDATSGDITFDGTSIREFDVGSLRKGIGYLTQTAMLFDESIRENLCYGLDTEPSEAQIRSALEGAFATFVYDLPEGLNTRLGDRGVRFSGGERQRIALARVLLEDNSILVLDEPTSALDSESEAYIQRALGQLHGTKTIVVIAHRLATVIQADQIFVMEEGRIVERGTHEQLLASDGAYKRLFESQLI